MRFVPLAYCLALAITVLVMADHEAVAQVALPGGVTTTADAGVELRMVDVDRDGGRRPAANVPVMVRSWRHGKGSAQRKRVGQQSLKTDAAGVIRLQSAARGVQREAVYSEDQREVSVPLDGARLQWLPRYHHAIGLDDAELDLRVDLQIRDGVMQARLRMTLSALRSGVLVLTPEQPLRLPLLAPVVREMVFDDGTIPKSARQVTVQVVGDGRIVRDRDSLELVGQVAPGRAMHLEIHYPIAVAGERIDLGVRGVVGKTHVFVGTVGVLPTRVRLQSARPARHVSTAEGRERVSALRLNEALQRGEIAVFQVSDYPTRASWPGGVLASLSLLGVLLVLGALRHHRWSSGEDA